MEESKGSREAGERDNSALILAAIIVFAACSRFIYLVSYVGNDPFSRILILDPLRYDRWAKAILEGKLFEQGAYYQAPLYPYFLSILYRLFGASYLPVYVAQMFIGLISILIVYYVAERFFSKREALIAAALLALYPATIFSESKLLPETIGILVILVLLSLLSLYQKAGPEKIRLRSLLSLLAGILLGISCLIRPNMLLLFPMLVLWMLFRREKAAVLLFCVGVAAAIAPVTVRNYVRSGELVLVSLNGGMTFSHGNNPYAMGVYTPLPGFSSDVAQQRIEERFYAQAEEKRELSDREAARFWYNKGIEFIKAHPWNWILLEAKKFFYFFNNYEHSLEYDLALERNYTVNLSFLPFGLIIPFAILGICISFPWRGKVPLILCILVQFMTVMIFYMSSRYRLPAVPVLAIFAGAGIARLIENVKRKEMNKIVIGCAIVIGVAIFSFIRIGEVYRFQEAAGYGNLGTAFNALGMNDEALSSFKKQYEIDPESAYALFNMAVVLAKKGEEGEAVQYYEKALKINPDLAEAYNNLGVIFVKWGQCNDAEALFLKAIELKPFFGNPYNNLATCYFMKGEIEKAVGIVKRADSKGAEISEELRREIMKKAQEEGK